MAGLARELAHDIISGDSRARDLVQLDGVLPLS